MSTNCELANARCSPCHGGVEPLLPSEAEHYLRELHGGWRVLRDEFLEKVFIFNDFREALDFVNAVGEIAEEQGHHPDIHLSWAKVQVRLWTHKIGGLHENDFILAAKIEAL